MTLHHQSTKLANAPALIFFKGSPQISAAQGTFLFYHGLGANKETNLKELDSIANRGFLAVGIDAVGHGERRWEDFEERLASDNPSMEDSYLAGILETARETPQVIDVLIEEWSVHEKYIGVGGISMGGFITYSALLEEPRLSVAAPILGSPCWHLPWSESPHNHLDRFWPRAILSQNAGLDVNVPPENAHAFHEALTPYYEKALHKQLYVEYPKSGHFMLEEDWNVLWSHFLDWFGIHLAHK